MAVLVPLLVRAAISAVEAKRLNLNDGFRLIFKGTTGKAEDGTQIPSDYWLAYVIGVGEMLAYPLLIVTAQPLIIGAWLAFKTVHRWHYAPDISRGPYNRYLVANAAILIGAYLSARWTVAI